jgi:parallel beta-helix repeat protein
MVLDNEIRFNETGLTVGSNQTIRGNHIHHNRRYGIAGGPANNILIEDNELSYNNTARHDPDDDAGGSKIVGGQTGTNGVTWRGNYVHNNHGQGIWSDGNVRNAIYEGNTVENNEGAGIDHEISWNAIVRNNKLANNNTVTKFQGKSCWHGAQIALNNSQNVSIYSNQVEAVDTNGICAVNSTRQEGPVFPQALANIYIYGNLIKMRGDVYTGTVGDEAPVNVIFFGNVYFVDNLSSRKWVFLRPMTHAQWRAEGREIGAWFTTW